MNDIALTDANHNPCLLGINPSGEIRMVTVDNNGIFGSGTPYPITGDEVALRDANGNSCALIFNSGYLVNLRLNNQGKIII